jgi:hypothetical protein
MIAFYAYIGAYEQASMARTFLVCKQDGSAKTQAWIAELDEILKVKRGVRCV